MILVKAFWNTDADGRRVDRSRLADEEGPVSYYGPFNDISDAVAWMDDDYPSDDTDLYEMIADDFELDDSIPVNAPDSIFGDIPDEDIRDDDPQDG